jgi:transposase
MLRFALLAMVVLCASCGYSGINTKKQKSTSSVPVTAEVPPAQIEQAQVRLLDRLSRLENLLTSLEGSIESLPEDERGEAMPRLSQMVERYDVLSAAANELPDAKGAAWRRAHANLIEDVRQLEFSATTLQGKDQQR